MIPYNFSTPQHLDPVSMVFEKNEMVLLVEQDGTMTYGPNIKNECDLIRAWVKVSFPSLKGPLKFPKGRCEK